VVRVVLRLRGHVHRRQCMARTSRAPWRQWASLRRREWTRPRLASSDCTGSTWPAGVRRSSWARYLCCT
jgi:hypothetical protein